MSDVSSLSAAKNMLRGQRFPEAIAIFERIINEKSMDSAEAAYCLAIVHHTGSGVPKSVGEAEKYYLIAEQYGHPLATWRLAGIYYSRGELQKSYNSYRSIAHNIPSAAYWAYQLLTIDNSLDDDSNASEEYLNSAADQSHALAQRIIAMRYVSGNEGLLKIPYGLALFIWATFNIFRVVLKGEKLKYE
jgi:TPR repeat protein